MEEKSGREEEKRKGRSWCNLGGGEIAEKRWTPVKINKAKEG